MSAVSRRGRWLRLCGFALAFAALVALGIGWAAPGRAELRAALGQIGALAWPILLLLGVLAVGGFAAEMLRFVVFARLLGVRLGWRAALETTIANHLFSWITPGVSLGEPVAVYVLVRHGVPVEAAVVIAFAKLLTSIAFIFGLTFALLAAGLGPPLGGFIGVTLAVSSGSAALVVLALVAGGARPRAAARLVDRFERIADARAPAPLARAARSLAGRARRSVELLAAARIGAAGALAVVLCHALYYAVFIAPLVTLAVSQGAPLGRTITAAIVYQGVIYLAPTPAGAGFGEASAGLFFGALLPRASAFVVVLVFRALTYYLHIAVGLAALPFSRALRDFVGRPSSDDPGA